MTDPIARLASALGDRYIIERELGAGGMATVYLAQDLKHARNVALKVLHPHIAETLGPERFLREIEIAAGLTHPHILPLHDSGDADGFLYYVMPFMEGESLQDRLAREGALPISEAVKIFREIVDALGEAHNRGVVHRDVKPANVLLTGGHALVADFGIAKAVGEAADSTKLTTAGMSLGTPEYMAPEQAAADPATDHRADLFAACAVGYELLTGKSPFHADTTQAVFAAVMTREPDPPHTIRKEVPGPLSHVIIRGLEKAPDDRPQSAAELLDQLDAIATATTGVTHWVSAAAQRRRRRLFVWVPVVFAFLALGVIGFRSLGWLPTDQTPTRATGPSGVVSYEKIAVMPFANQMNDPEQEYFVDGMTDALITELAKINSIGVVSRTSIMRFKNSDRAIPEIAAELGADAIIEGSVLRAGDGVRIGANLVDAARDETLWANSYTGSLNNVLQLQANVVLDIAAEINAALTPAEQSQFASVTEVDPRAHDAYLRGRHFWNQRTEPSFERAIELFNEAIRIEPEYALAYAGLADAYALVGIYEYIEPQTAYQRARETALRAIELDPLAGEPHTLLGHVLGTADHDWPAAWESYERGLELSPSNSQGYLFNAFHLMATGDLDGARAVIQNAQRLDPLAPLGGTFRTQLRLYRRDTEGAIAEARRALEIDRDFLPTLWRLGESYLAAEQNDLAVEAFERVVEITQRHPLFLSYLGLAYGRAGRAQDARDLIAEIESNTANEEILAGRLARLYVGLGEHDAAILALQQSIDTGQMVFMDLWGGPVWDPLRGDPRFQAILVRLGFPNSVAP